MAYNTLAAPAVIDREKLASLEQEARKRALEQAAESGARVSEIGNIEKKEIRELLTGDRQDHGNELPPQPAETRNESAGNGQSATRNAPTMTAAQAEQALAARADDADRKRVAQTGDTPDARVMQSKDATVGLQHDATRKVELATSVLTDDAVKSGLTKRVSVHEGDHQKQETGDQAADLPPTGNAAIDGYRQGFRRLQFRETNSIKAAGGLEGHTAEYHGYVAYTSAVKSELNRAGENGEAMVHEAGRTVEGFRRVHAVLVRQAVTNELKKGNMKQAADMAREADRTALAA